MPLPPLETTVIPPVETIRQELYLTTIAASTLRKLLRLAIRHESELARVRSESQREDGYHVG
jgi:hypothetical protein